MEKFLPLLKKNILFADLPDDVLAEEILPKASLREYAKGQCAIAPQQRVDRLGVVVSGKIHVTHIFASGNDSLMDVITYGGAGLGSLLFGLLIQQYGFNSMFLVWGLVSVLSIVFLLSDCKNETAA